MLCMEQPSNTNKKSQQYFNGLNNTCVGNNKVYLKMNICRLETKNSDQNMPVVHATSLKQPSNTSRQSKRCYNGLKATWVNSGGLNPLTKEFILQSKNNQVNVPVFSDKGHGHSSLGVVTQECNHTNIMGP